MADGLLNKASIILTPTGYKAGTLYNVAPVVEPYEDFDFARASVASRVNSSGLVEMVGRTLGSELVQNGDFSELGSELVTNGDFATDSNWSGTGSNGISISDGKLNFNNSPYTANSAQSNVTTVGKTYKIVFTVSDYVKGSVRIFLGGSATSTASANGTYTFYLTASSNTTIGVQVLDGGGTTLSVDNVSVKQVDPNNYWNEGTGWSIADGKATSIGSNYGQQLKQTILQTNKIYKLSFDIVDYTSGNIALESIYYGVTQTFNVIGSYVTYFTSLSQTELRLYSQNFIGSIDNVSVKEVIDTNNIPRISYDSNGDNGHILLEPTSTNLFPYSEDFTTYSIQGRIELISNSSTSPDGLTNSTKIIPTAVSGTHKLRENLSTVTGTFTQSIFAKQGGYKNILLWDDTTSSGIGVNLDDLSIFRNQNTLGYNIESFDDDWVRVSVSYSLTSQQLLPSIYIYDNSATPQIVFTGDGTSGIYVWGAQLEELSYATSYIPTLTGSTETRATETATGAGSADLINSTEGVLYAEIAALADDDTSYRAIFINDGTNNNRVGIRYSNTSNQIQALSYKDGSLQGFGDYTLSNSEQFNKIAFKYKANDFALWINGVEVDTDTSGDVYTVGTLNNIDFSAIGGQNFYGKCKALAVFNEALSDSELTQLTT